MTTTMTADISLDAWTVAASAVARAVVAPAQPIHEVPDTAAQGPVYHGRKDAIEVDDKSKPEYLTMNVVRIDGGTQARVNIDDSIVAEYAYNLRDGEILPPVVVFFDGADFWLADGFHRYRAHQAVGANEIAAQVCPGTRRNAVLYSVGANASHGLRRTNDDKHKAVKTLLDDPEWSAWSDREIARQCGVSDRFVNGLRTSANRSQMGNAPTTRTVTRNGKTYEQKTEKIGKARRVQATAAPAPQVDEVLEVATSRRTPEKGGAAITRVDELLAENEALREQLDDLRESTARLLADNDMMARVFEADDQVRASMIEVARYRAVAEQAERTLAGRAHEFEERARLVKYWKNRAEKAEKQLGVEAGDAA